MPTRSTTSWKEPCSYSRCTLSRPCRIGTETARVLAAGGGGRAGGAATTGGAFCGSACFLRLPCVACWSSGSWLSAGRLGLLSLCCAVSPVAAATVPSAAAAVPVVCVGSAPAVTSAEHEAQRKCWPYASSATVSVQPPAQTHAVGGRGAARKRASATAAAGAVGDGVDVSF